MEAKHVMRIEVTVEKNEDYCDEPLKTFIEKIEREYGGNHTLIWKINVVDMKAI